MTAQLEGNITQSCKACNYIFKQTTDDNGINEVVEGREPFLLIEGLHVKKFDSCYSERKYESTSLKVIACPVCFTMKVAEPGELEELA